MEELHARGPKRNQMMLEAPIALLPPIPPDMPPAPMVSGGGCHSRRAFGNRDGSACLDFLSKKSQSHHLDLPQDAAASNLFSRSWGRCRPGRESGIWLVSFNWLIEVG